MGVVFKTKNLDGLIKMGANDHQVTVLLEWGAVWHKGPTLTLQINNSVYKSTTINPGPVVVKSFLAKVIDEHMTTVMDAVEEETKDMPDLVAPEEKVIPLRHAKAMYQRVIGTSHSSVYVVVAISSKADIKVAAKISGMALSVRAEGDGLNKPKTVERLSSQGLTHKNGSGGFSYMSQHYSCDGDSPPEKVLGAILMGTGIPFDTVMPIIDKVKEGSA